MVERRLTGMIAAAAVLIVLFIFWDVFRPVARAVDSSAPPPTTPAVDSVARLIAPPAPPAPPPAAAQPVAPATTTSQGTAGPIVPAGRQPTYFDLLARSQTRRRTRVTRTTAKRGRVPAAQHASWPCRRGACRRRLHAR